MAVQKWFTGTVAPTSAPANIGDFYIDTTNDKAYVAVGTGTVADYKEFSLAATAPGLYRNIWIDPSLMTPTTTNGAASASVELATNDIMTVGYDFDSATNEYVQFSMMMPDEWDKSNLKAKIYWKDAATAGTGDVIWGIQGGAISNDDPIDTALGTAQTVTDTFIASDDLHISSATATITVAGTAALADWIVFKVYRDAAAGGDTYTQDARLLGVALQYLETTTAQTGW